MASIYRTSKHVLKYQTKYKTEMLNWIFEDYKATIEHYIDLIINGSLSLDNKGYMSSKYLPDIKFINSAWKVLAYKEAASLIKSQIKRANRKRYKRYKQLYAKCKERNKCKWFTNKRYSELILKPVYRTKYFTKPKLKNISIELNYKLFDIQKGNHFDEFIKIRSPYKYNNIKKYIPIKLPLKYHRHSYKFKEWERIDSLRLTNKNGKYFINLVYCKENKINKNGYSLGVDQGYKKLLTCSDGKILGNDLENLYNEISNKKQGSKEFKRKLIQRDNLINYYCNQLDVNNIGEIVIENLKNIKQNTKKNKKLNTNFTNKLQRWSYRKTIDRLERLCEENGILLTKVNPAYTSQTCSWCGHIDKNSRNGEEFSCQYCGRNLDADLNAAINLSHMGVCRPHSPNNYTLLGGN